MEQNRTSDDLSAGRGPAPYAAKVSTNIKEKKNLLKSIAGSITTKSKGALSNRNTNKSPINNGTPEKSSSNRKARFEDTPVKKRRNLVLDNSESSSEDSESENSPNPSALAISNQNSGNTAQPLS